MDFIYVALAIIIIGVIWIGIFVLGMLFMRAIVRDEQQEARYDALRYEYYRLAGVTKPSDPRPYVPPRPVTPRANRQLPGLSQLDRLMKEGKRGTILWRPSDRKSAC